MTSSKPTKVGSFQRQEKKKMAQYNRTTKTVAPRKPLNLNFCNLGIEWKMSSVWYHSDVTDNISAQEITKSLMCGSLNGQPIAEPNYHFKIGDNYDEKRISTLQSNKVQHRCKDSNSKNWQSLQVQHQLPYNLDSQVQTKSLERQGGRSA